MVSPSRFFFISFEIKPDVTFIDFTTKKWIFTILWFQNCKIVRCYCHDLGQSERDSFDFFLCELVPNLLDQIRLFVSKNNLF